ncbi:hypothetical protein PHMEG_00031480, partial [Phytophthora megakarya]
MGHADGLSRLIHLPTTGSTLSAVRRRRISAIPSAPMIVRQSGTWKGTATTPAPGVTSPNASSDVVVEVGEATSLGGSTLFEDDESNVRRVEDSGADEVGEQTPEESQRELDQPRIVTQEEQEEDEEGLEEVDWRSNEDTSGLDSEKFVEEQLRTPWMIAMKAFLESGALAMDSQLRILILRMAPQFEMRDGVLMRHVHLRTRAGPANTKLVPVIPLRFVETVLYYCHGDLMSAHLGKTKTLEKVRHHAYCPGWKRMLLSTLGAVISVTVEKVRDRGELVECSECQSRTYQDHFRWSLWTLLAPYLLQTEGTNYFTRWAEAFAIQALDSITFVN